MPLPYLTVESLEPLIITLSSYCKQRTDPVWPVRTFTQLRVSRSQIWKESDPKLAYLWYGVVGLFGTTSLEHATGTPTNLDGVVAQTRDDLLIVVLQAIDAFAVLGVAIDSMKNVSAHLPVVFDVLKRNRLWSLRRNGHFISAYLNILQDHRV